MVHKHLMQKEGGKLSEMTPSELYEIFVEISRVKFHIILTFNHEDSQAKRLLRKHKSILNAATQINLRVSHLLKLNCKIPTYLYL